MSHCSRPYLFILKLETEDALAILGMGNWSTHSEHLVNTSGKESQKLLFLEVRKYYESDYFVSVTLKDLSLM